MAAVRVMKGMAMFNPLLPSQADNSYRGHKIALWLFALLLFAKLGQSLNVIFNSRYVAMTADGIPLDAYTPAAAQTVVALFSLLGLATLMICLVCILVLARYRSLVPVMFLVLMLQFLGGRLVLLFHPLERTGTPIGVYVNLALFAVMIVGLALSLWSRGDWRAQEGRGAN